VPQSNGNQHFGSAAKEVAEHASTLTRLEVELATLELKNKAVALGTGAGIGLAAGLVGFLGLCFALATIAAALATAMSVWLALLIVTAGLFAIAGIAGVVGLGRLKSGTPPVPEKAIREAKLTTQAMKR
jgi:hypothetical protein